MSTVTMARKPVKKRYSLTLEQEVDRCMAQTGQGRQCTLAASYRHGRYKVCGHHNGNRGEQDN